MAGTEQQSTDTALRIAELKAALKAADAAMAYAQWGASHPARMAIRKALGDE